MTPLYLALDLAAVVIPVAFSFHPRLKFYRHFPGLFSSILITGLVFIAWDNWFVKLGVWGFNPAYLTGISFLNLPLEEYLFFLCVPIACVFTFHVVRTLVPDFSLPPRLQNTTALVGAVLLIVFGLLNYSLLYTSFAFIAAGLSLMAAQLFFKELLPHFLLSFLANLIPFALMNGILTGTFIPQPIVWYNDNENLGLRMLTIPFEDLFYGLALLLWNTMLTDYFNQRFNKKHKTVEPQ